MEHQLQTVVSVLIVPAVQMDARKPIMDLGLVGTEVERLLIRRFGLFKRALRSQLSRAYQLQLGSLLPIGIGLYATKFANLHRGESTFRYTELST